MDKFQAAFEILYFLSAIDGQVHKKEHDVIQRFLDENFGGVHFEPNAVIKSIASMTGEGRFDELTRAAVTFGNLSSAHERTILLDFAMQLIAADGKLAKNEQDLFFLLGNTWKVDMPSYFASKGVV